MVNEFPQAQMPGEGGRQEQTGIGHQAVIVKGDTDTVGVVAWQHLLGAPSLGLFCWYKTIIPDSEEHPFVSSAGLLHAVLRWIRVKVKVTFTDDAGNQESMFSAPSSPVDPGPTPSNNNPAEGNATISGTAKVGETLTVDVSGITDADGMEDASFGFTWTDGTYWLGIGYIDTWEVLPSYVGKQLTVHWNFHDDMGYHESGEVTSAVVVATVPEEPRAVAVEPVGTGELDVSWVEPDSDGGSEITSYTVQWKKATGIWDADEDVSEATATSTTHTITGLELDVEYAVRIIATNSIGDGAASDEVTATTVAAKPNSPATGTPTVSGTAQVGETLTADTTGIDDSDGLANVSFSYQWIRSDGSTDTNIAGQTTSMYTLADADEGQTIKVRVSFTDGAGNQEMLTSAPTAAVAAPAQADSEDEPSELSYLTVVVTEDDSDPDNVFTTFTITWNDAEDCSASYNAYLDGVAGDPIHLGSAASEGEQIAASLTNVSAESIGFDAKLYCGTIGSGRLVDSLWIPEYSRSFDTVPISRAYLPKPGTYSTEPGLTALTVSSGTLTPAFHSQTLNYTVPDVANADGRITLTTTTKADYYTVAFMPGSLYFYISLCSHGGQQTSLSYQDDTGNPLYPLTDADADTPGFQMELDEGENVFKIRVWPNCENGHVYKLTVTRAADAPANTPATGAPTISGAAQVGETLTAATSGIADADGLSGATFSYQWLSSRDTEIQGATDAAYILVPGDAGKTIKVRVTFTDDEGNAEMLTSAATDAVSPAPTPNNPATGAPTISGTAQVGETLAANTSEVADSDGLSNVQYEYQWLADDAEISGATGSTYTVAAADEGKAIKVEVSFTDDAGDEEALTSAATDAVSAEPTPNSPATGAPTVSGTAQVGETLTADTSGIADADGLSSVQYEFQWLADDAEISGATSVTYTLVDADEGKAIKVEATFTDDAGNAETLTSAATGVVAPRPNSPATGAPTIGGTAQVGQTLTASTSGIADADGLTGATFSYQWLSSRDTEIQGAMGAAYILVPGDAGKTIKVKVSFTDEAGNEETLTSEATAAVAAALPPPPGNVRAVTQKSGAVELTWEAPDGATVTGYRIERSRADENRGGQQRSDGRPRDNHTLVEDTGSADTGYTDKSAEKGVEYEYRVSARNEAGTGEASEWVRAGPESASNSPATGAPTIRGTTQVGETLTAGISGIADADGLSGETFTYQWVSSDGTTDTDLEKATDSTYKLVDADQGKSVKVRVTFTDGGGNEETLTSAPTGPVFSDGPPGAPRNLTATAGNKEVTLSWDPPADNGNAPATRYRIEWRIDGKDYSRSQRGTSGKTTYTKTDLANGVKYVFRVKAENGTGNYGPYGPASEEVSVAPTSGSAVDLGTPVLSNTKTLHHGMVQLDWQDIEDAGWYVVQYYHVEDGEWLDLPAEGVDIAFPRFQRGGEQPAWALVAEGSSDELCGGIGVVADRAVVRDQRIGLGWGARTRGGGGRRDRAMPRGPGHAGVVEHEDPASRHGEAGLGGHRGRRPS